MDDYLKDLNLIDLLSERHKQVRAEVRKRWLEKMGEEITDTETHLLGMLEIKNMTVAESARKIHVSRQATHKCARKLIDCGYIMMQPIEGNKRDKLLILTERGKSYCDEMLKLKRQVEEEISNQIGHENIELLKIYLRKAWLD